ncbi:MULTISPECIES: hypothetical protein [Sporomusa]|jgi:hypothetical protein|uniref:hypothetical protein n=1 Tax=Sporomusa TaxID=2375 RepID=UPI0016681BE6|nr:MULTISPECIES: hypothetical protein [Sporomusa]HML34733.1 hypothetical protein [Sporomusa sphaeroides]
MLSLTDVWARQLIAWEEIPGLFRPFVPADRLPPYLIYSPPDGWGSCKVNARLTMLCDKKISVLENTVDGVQVSEWLLDDLDYVEQGAVHLYSWLRLSGVAVGRPAVVQVEYNAVAAALFTQVVQAVRQTWGGASREVRGEGQEALESLAAIDYRFLNYAKECVLPGERVFTTVYQPELTIPRFLFSRRRLTAAYVCVLTDRELIFVSDAGSGGSMGRYGVVRRYIPLAKIKEWQLEPATWDKTGVWQLKLPGECIAIHFSAPAQSSLLVLAALLDEIRGG